MLCTPVPTLYPSLSSRVPSGSLGWKTRFLASACVCYGRRRSCLKQECTAAQAIKDTLLTHADLSVATAAARGLAALGVRNGRLIFGPHSAPPHKVKSLNDEVLFRDHPRLHSVLNQLSRVNPSRERGYTHGALSLSPPWVPSGAPHGESAPFRDSSSRFPTLILRPQPPPKPIS